jgi:hypothetical protein
MVAPGPVTAAPAELISATKDADIVAVPARLVLALSGEGSPHSDEFASSIAALYGIAYGLKFRRKKATGDDFKVGPLVGIWRAADEYLTAGGVPPQDAWRWTLQIDVPRDVTPADLEATVKEAIAKRGGKLEGSTIAPHISLVEEPPRRFGRILHVGSYADEPASFEAIGAVLQAQGLSREPWHVEVYISDPGRVAPEKLKTVLLAPLAD